MSSPKSTDKPAAAEGSGAQIYDTDTPAAAKKSGPGVYDTPSRAGGLPLGIMVGVGVVVALLILAFLLFQFVF
ncbi:MAG: hypothetical protein HGA45_14205 [Chloroflexales bacterium]|nr:hypothetical protein [Chloroflexales bacterium]